MGLFVPARRRGREILDDPGADPALETRALRDVALANRLFGGTAAVLATLAPLLRAARAPLTLLDVGTGAGDIPQRARGLARRCHVALDTIGLERSLPLATDARSNLGCAVVGDALALPFADRSVDIVTCSQVLHHFADAEAILILRELHRVARGLVVVADLRRSWGAVVGLWASSFALGFHPVSRQDGVLSVLRGYRRAELSALVQAAVGTAPNVRDRLGFRVTASWTPA